jgi:hypothetical protein
MKITNDDRKAQETPDDSAWSAQDHEYAMKQQKNDLEAKHSDEKREYRREKERAEKAALDWKRKAERAERLLKKSEESNAIPDSVNTPSLEVKKTAPDKAPDNSGNEASA